MSNVPLDLNVWPESVLVQKTQSLSMVVVFLKRQLILERHVPKEKSVSGIQNAVPRLFDVNVQILPKSQ